MRTSDHVVRLPADTYRLTQGELSLGAPGVTIQGDGARTTTIDGQNGTRVLHVVGGSNQVSGVRITRGRPVAIESDTLGGGVLVDQGATLGLAAVAVVGNSAAIGGGIASDGTLTLDRSTVAGNHAQDAQFTNTTGGGIYHDASAITTLINSTISGNVASVTPPSNFSSSGGGIFQLAGTLTLRNVTIARNGAQSGGGLYNSDGSLSLKNTIIADSVSGGACGGLNPSSEDHSIDDDNTCGLIGVGDKPGVDPQLAPLAANSGVTDTHAILPSSPAFNGGFLCQSTDQRGVARPQLGVCDIGAYEYRSPRLTVVKHVVNDHGGTLTAADFNLHVRRTNGTDVGGSPAAGSESGRTYLLAPGTYVIREDADSRYSAAIGGSCAANGVVTLAEGQSKTCTITNDDKKPVAGKDINGAPKRGTVRVKFPGDSSFHQLTDGDQLPNNTIVDTRNGRITLYVAGKNGKVTNADFYEGLFKLKQSKKGKKTTTLTLIEKLSCKGVGKAANAARKRKRRRHLWGDGHGSFTTKGRNSAATVLGTKWLVQDTCTTTLTKVKRGKVRVRDFIKHKTVIVRKGHRYIARSKP